MKRDYWSEEALAERQSAADMLNADLDHDAEGLDFELQEVLRETGQARVYRASLDGAPIIIKRFTTKDAAQIVVRAKTELDHLEQVFGDSEYQANRCILALPDKGIIVLSFAPGQRLDDEIGRLSGQARADVLAQSGRWIMKYAEGRTRTSTFAPGYWIRKLESLPKGHIDAPEDLDLPDRLLQALRLAAKPLGGTSALKAAVHSDFVGMNALYHEGVLYGVDIQGECWMAMSRAVGRFLVWQQVHDDTDGMSRRFGLDREDWRAFMSGDVLSELEQSTTLPFFIGVELYARFISEYRRKRIRSNCRLAIEAFLSEKWGLV
ncbi:MAG: hypothetical protein ACK5LJ_15670 [Paracoccus sp. (in: a-proteobacteria)]